MARGKGGLGRGLDSLFEDAAPVFESGAKVDTLPLREIEPDPEQPRKTFDEQAPSRERRFCPKTASLIFSSITSLQPSFHSFYSCPRLIHNPSSSFP